MKLFTIVISDGQSAVPPFDSNVLKAHIVNERTRKHRMIESPNELELFLAISDCIKQLELIDRT